MGAVTLAATDPEAYMEAFMNGFDFVLLAIRGRLAEADMHPAERARLELFLQDYSKIAQAFRDRRADLAPRGLAIHGSIKSQLEPMATN
jgi:hypothetical protein